MRTQGTGLTASCRKVHSQRRKLFANALTKNSLLEWEDVLHEKVSLAIAGVMKEAQTKGKADIFAWFTFMVSLTHAVAPVTDIISMHQANDVIATLSFGDSFKLLENGQVICFPRRDIDLH